jgi:hypothetical protein
MRKLLYALFFPFAFLTGSDAESAPILSANSVAVSPQAVSRGGVLSTLLNVIPGVSVSGVKAFVTISSFDGSTTYAMTPVALGDLSAGASVTISNNYTIPPWMSDGLYSVSISFLTSTPGVALPPIRQIGTFGVGQTGLAARAGLPSAHLTFADNFTGAKLNRSLWAVNYPFPSNPNSYEAQIYSPDAVYNQSGILRLVATASANVAADGREIRSGVITSFGSFAQQYGHFELRGKLPNGEGLWPAFWMLPNDQSWPPELDVMEYLGRQPGTIFSTNHWTGADGQRAQESSYASGVDFASGYHVFALDWRPDLIRFSLDGVETGRQTTHVPSQAMYMIANLAVASGGWPGAYNATTPFPSYFDIDYIRAYQFDDLSPPLPSDIRFRKAVVSNLTPAAGERIRIDGAFETGANDLGDVLLHFFIRSFDGKTQHYYSQLALGAAPGRSILPFSLYYRIPAAMPRGVYVVAFAVTAANGVNVSSNVAERISIGAP